MAKFMNGEYLPWHFVEIKEGHTSSWTIGLILRVTDGLYKNKIYIYIYMYSGMENCIVAC